jgi:hypothetical protein
VFSDMIGETFSGPGSPGAVNCIPMAMVRTFNLISGHQARVLQIHLKTLMLDAGDILTYKLWRKRVQAREHHP